MATSDVRADGSMSGSYARREGGSTIFDPATRSARSGAGCCGPAHHGFRAGSGTAPCTAAVRRGSDPAQIPASPGWVVLTLASGSVVHRWANGATRHRLVLIQSGRFVD